MKRTVTWSLMVAVLVGVTFVATVPAVGQPAAQVEPEPAEDAGEDFERMAASQDLHEQMQMFIEMGMDEEEALFFSLMTSGKMDPATMMLMMAMMDGGGGGEAMGIMLLMNAMSGSKAAAQPVVLDRGETLLIVEEGVLYKINLEEMKLEGSVAYAAGAQAGGQAMAAMLGPMIQKAREKARQASCLSNMKQLALAFMMYQGDFDGELPGETWAQDTQPYLKNTAILVCPSRPELPVGYAMNEKLLLAKLEEIPRVGETVLLFESNVGGNNPVGGPDDVPEEGVHNGGINVGYVDGHCKWVTVEAARDLLEQEPF